MWLYIGRRGDGELCALARAKGHTSKGMMIKITIRNAPKSSVACPPHSHTMPCHQHDMHDTNLPRKHPCDRPCVVSLPGTILPGPPLDTLGLKRARHPQPSTHPTCFCVVSPLPAHALLPQHTSDPLHHTTKTTGTRTAAFCKGHDHPPLSLGHQPRLQAALLSFPHHAWHVPRPSRPKPK